MKPYLHNHAYLFLTMLKTLYKISSLKEKRLRIYLPNDCIFSISDVCYSAYLSGFDIDLYHIKLKYYKSDHISNHTHI